MYAAMPSVAVNHEFSLLVIVLVLASSLALAWSSAYGEKHQKKEFRSWGSWWDLQRERGQRRGQFANALFAFLAIGFVLVAITDWLFDLSFVIDNDKYMLFAGITVVLPVINTGILNLTKKEVTLGHFFCRMILEATGCSSGQ